MSSCIFIYYKTNMKTLQQFKEWLKPISFPTYVCCIFLGISSWIDLGGLWVEVPLLVNQLPEGWKLPSYLATIMQTGQLGPLLFIIANRCSPNKVKEWPVIFIIIGTGAISCLLLAFLWQQTSIVAGNLHSTALFVLSATLAFLDTTSSVVFLGYMSIFKQQYMTGYYIGEGLSSLIPGLVGLGQGVGGDPTCVNTSNVVYNETTGENITNWREIPVYQKPNFSVQTFFLFLSVVLSASFVAFTILHFAPFVKKEYCSYVDALQEVPADTEKEQDEVNDITISSCNDFKVSQKQCTRDEDGRDHTKAALTNRKLVGIIILEWWRMFLSIGCHNSLESYALLTYGDRAYGLSVRLSKIAGPIACSLTLLMPRISVTKMLLLALVGTVSFFYELTLAILSPYPPLQDKLVGEVLAVGSAVFMVFIFEYLGAVVAIYLQSRGGRRALLWNGAIGQFGVFCGSLIMFLVIKVNNMLTRSYRCRL